MPKLRIWDVHRTEIFDLVKELRTACANVNNSNLSPASVKAPVPSPPYMNLSTTRLSHSQLDAHYPVTATVHILPSFERDHYAQPLDARLFSRPTRFDI